jgi:hypothetical protein
VAGGGGGPGRSTELQPALSHKTNAAQMSCENFRCIKGTPPSSVGRIVTAQEGCGAVPGGVALKFSENSRFP